MSVYFRKSISFLDSEKNAIGISSGLRARHSWIRIILFSVGLFAVSPSFAEWLALAVDDNSTWGIALRQPSKKQAESMALKECSKAKGVKCRVVGTTDRLGYVAVATSKTSVWAYVDDTLAGAKRAALEACAKQTSTDDTCMIKWTGINGAVRAQPRTAQTTDCRPRTREIRCRSSCINGDCVVEYENGCKIRIQVSPRFDPFSNEWTYPSPSC